MKVYVLTGTKKELVPKVIRRYKEVYSFDVLGVFTDYERANQNLDVLKHDYYKIQITEKSLID